MGTTGIFPECIVDEWVDPDLLVNECAPVCPEVLEHDLSGFAAEAASWLFWITGCIFTGCCPRVAEPCFDPCDRCRQSHWNYKFTPVMVGGQWKNTICGCCGPEDCCTKNGIPLLPTPVRAVNGVTINGVALDPSEYELSEGKVCLLSGDWPDCGGVEIDYESGKPVPPFLAAAARAYTRERACECYCPSKCSFPKGWTELDFPHAKVRRDAPTGDEASGLLAGLPTSMVRAIRPFLTNGGNIQRRGRVFSPDIQEPIHGRLA